LFASRSVKPSDYQWSGSPSPLSEPGAALPFRVPMAEDEVRHLRVLIANEKRDRLELLAQVVAGLGHEVIAREIYVKEVGAVTARERPDVALVALLETRHLLNRIAATPLPRGRLAVAVGGRSGHLRSPAPMALVPGQGVSRKLAAAATFHFARRSRPPGRLCR
jgi:hypothetical protein